jgi:hypothetical protein
MDVCVDLTQVIPLHLNPPQGFLHPPRPQPTLVCPAVLSVILLVPIRIAVKTN